MGFSGYNKFVILLWKNFTLKKRQLNLLVLEIILMLLFASVLLVTCYLVIVKKDGPIRFSAQSINDVPSFLRTPISFPGDWELAYVPSKSIVVKTIIEHVRNDLNIKMKVQGFSSEKDFEDYVKSNSQKIVVAIVFDHNFKDNRDPLPLKVKYYRRFSNFQRSKMLMGNFQVRSWRTAFPFPPVPSIGPRNQYDEDGGSPGSVINQENQKIVNYYIPSQDNSWGKVFGLLEKAKEQLHLEDYSITQIMLEQVFLMFANPDKTRVGLEIKVP